MTKHVSIKMYLKGMINFNINIGTSFMTANINSNFERVLFTSTIKYYNRMHNNAVYTMNSISATEM